MKVLLTAVNAKYIHSNPAVYSLKEYGESKFREENIYDKVEIEIAEYTINQPPAGILADIYRKKPDLVFFSCYIWNKICIFDLIWDMERVMPETDVWLGGPEVSFDGKEILDRFSNVRGVAKGEGEETFYRTVKMYMENTDDNKVKLCDSLKNISGIVFKDNDGKVKETVEADYVDLSSIPFLYMDTKNFSNRIIYYESSRGCPYRCSYCLSSIDKKLRFRSMDAVKRELDFFMERGVQQVKFVDRTFNCDRDRAFEIWDFLKREDNGKTNFHFEIAGDLMEDRELDLLRTMRSGQIQLEIGVQSTNERTLEAINRPMDFEKLSQAVGTIREGNNIHIHLDLIAGLPFEDYESFRCSFNDVIALRPHQLQLGFLKVLKGSPIEKRCEEYGIRYSYKPPYEVLKTDWISYDELIRLKRIEEMVEVYYNSGQFNNSLEYIMGFFTSPFDFFEGLAWWHESEIEEMIKLSRNKRYENLLAFAEKSEEFKLKGSMKTLLEKMAIDYYLRDNVKNRPEFLGKGGVDKDFLKNFYSKEAREHRYLLGEAYDTEDPRTLRNLTHVEKMGEVYYLFDYCDRDLMANNARIIEIK